MLVQQHGIGRQSWYNNSRRFLIRSAMLCGNASCQRWVSEWSTIQLNSTSTSISSAQPSAPGQASHCRIDVVLNPISAASFNAPGLAVSSTVELFKASTRTPILKPTVRTRHDPVQAGVCCVLRSLSELQRATSSATVAFAEIFLLMTRSQ